MTAPRLALCCLLPLALPPLCAAAPGDPVIPEVGFEDGLSPFRIVSGRCEVDREVTHSGTGSLRISDAGSVVLGDLDIAGKCWVLSYWMRTENVVRGPEPWHRAGAQVQMLDAEGRGAGKGHFDIDLTLGTTDWARHERTIPSSPAAW